MGIVVACANSVTELRTNGNQDHHHTISDRDYTLAMQGSREEIRATTCAISRRNRVSHSHLFANSFSFRGASRAFYAAMVRTNKKLDPAQTGNDAAKLRSSLQKLVVRREEADLTDREHLSR